MNEKDVLDFQELLQSQLNMLLDLDELGSAGQKTVKLDQQSVGRLSRIDALQQQAMSKATHQRRQQQKTRITAALKRIDEGEFGYCVSCGEDIPVKRLELDAAVATCISCASG